jgi:tetratricopeptide (TPR) repeat protein
LLCILTLAGCRQGAHYRADLLRADSVMDARPDSAYGIVARLRPDSLDDANRALLCLLTTQAKWKTDRDISNDTAWDAAIRHFTEQEDYDRLAKCYYYRGIVYKERNEVEKALAYYLKAASYSKKTNDIRIKYLILSYIGILYNEQALYENAYTYHKRAIHYAEAEKDTSHIISSIINANFYLIAKERYKECIRTCLWALKMKRTASSTEANTNAIYGDLALAYFHDRQYPLSEQYCDSLLSAAKDSTSGDYYNAHGLLADIYYNEKRYDLSKAHCMITLKSPYAEDLLPVLKIMSDIMVTHGNNRSANEYLKKYQAIYEDKVNNLKTAEVLKTNDAIVVKAEKGRYKTKINKVYLVISSLLAVSVFLFMRRRKARDMKHLRDIYSKMQADWQAEKSREMEQLQQEMEALRTNIGQPQEDAEKMKALQQRLSQLEADNGKLAEMVAHHKNLHTEIFSGRYDNALACLHKVNTHPKADMITKLDWTQLYLLIDAIDPTFRSTYEPEKGSPIHDFNMQCLRFLGVEVSNIAIVFNGITKASASKGIYRSKHRGRQ